MYVLSVKYLAIILCLYMWWHSPCVVNGGCPIMMCVSTKAQGRSPTGDNTDIFMTPSPELDAPLYHTVEENINLKISGAWFSGKSDLTHRCPEFPW